MSDVLYVCMRCFQSITLQLLLVEDSRTRASYFLVVYGSLAWRPRLWPAVGYQGPAVDGLIAVNHAASLTAHAASLHTMFSQTTGYENYTTF